MNGKSPVGAATKRPVRNSYLKHTNDDSKKTPRHYETGASGSTSTAGLVSEFDAVDMSSVNFKYDESKSIERGVGMKIRVSGVFPHYSKPLSYARVFLGVPDSLFYLDGRFLRVAYDNAKDQLFTRQGKEIPLYMSSLGDIPLCVPSNPEEYKRNRQNWTQSVVYFDVEFPNHLGSVELFVNNALKTLASNYTDRSECGANFASWLKVNKAKLYGRETGVTGNKRKVSHDQFAATLQSRLVRGFSQRTIEWNVPLDSVITYGHIKEWVSGTLGYEHWHQLPQHVKELILTKRHGTYPDWDETEVKPLSYNG